MTESVARVRIVANIEGLEGFDKLKNAFKGLQQAIGPTEQQLSRARREIIDFGSAGKQTEQVIRGQVEALRSLQSQADLTGEVYGEIASDISRLEAALRGTTPALERQRVALLQNASANNDNAEALARNVQQLERLRAETRPGSSAYAQLGRDIQTLRTRITGITGAAAEFRLTLTQIPGASLGVLARQVGTLQRGMQGLRVASDEYLRTAERIALLQTIQGRFTGRQQVRANFEMFASEQFAGFAEGPGERLVLPDTTAALQQRLSELGQELQNVARDSERYINVALRMAGVQRELGAATQGLGQRLADQLANGELPRTQRNLQEAISQLRSEMSDLDTTTADGSREYAQRASVVTTLTQQLNRLAEAYRNVGDAQRSQPVSQFTLARGQQPYDPSSGRRAPSVLTDAEAASVEGARNVAQNARAAFDSIGDIADTALRRLVDLEEKHFQEMLSLAEEQDKRELDQQQQAFQRQLAAFDAQLTAADRLAVRSGQLKMMLGVGGRDLSPLYQSIVEMGSSREASAEMFMRKSPTEVLRDITDTFTDTFADASRALDSGEKEIRRAALEFAGNAKAVRGAFEQIPLGDKRAVLGGPRSLFPNEGESPADYTRRVGSLYPTIGVENRTFGQAIGDFVAQIKFRTQQLEKATDGDERASQRLRQSLLEFVEGIDNGADTVRAAFGRYKLGKEPVSLFAAPGETPREYVARLGGGVADPIPDLGDFSKKSIRELNLAKQALEQYRAELSPTGVAFQTLERTAVRSIRNIDRELERRSPGGRLAGKIGYIGQGIGAAASAGIFGGPEGAIGGIGGGLLGALAGGPAGFAAGAFIGSSAGAYAGMARQQLGQFTTYAADIGKLEIALKGVTKTQQEYQRALAASASVTRDFNVPQLEATKGMTQLSAAVIGAGGKVADAEVVFRNVTAAIKASGGTSEDVQGALTALGQIFSKGKVSAEELQGQLGERLPGAVTMFAKATGRTLPQLQKDLEQGVVGLADLMKFITSDQGLGQFEQRALDISKSSADAGARLVTTWNDTKRAIGEALLPLGAQIQDSLANALRAATPALVEFAKGAAAAIKALIDNADTIGSVLKTLLGFAAVAGAAVAMTQLATTIGSAALAIQSLGGAMGVATIAARTLGVSIAAIPGIGWLAAGTAALGLLTVELYNNNYAFRTWANNLATVISTDFKNAWDSAVTIVSGAVGIIEQVLEKVGNFASAVGTSIASTFDSVFGGLFSRVQEFWNSLPAPVRQAMSQAGTNAAGSLLAPGNPVAGYLYGAASRAAQMGPNAQSVADMGRYIPGEVQRQFKTDRLNSGLTNWQQTQAQNADRDRRAREKAQNDLFQKQLSLLEAKLALLREEGRLTEANAITEYDKAQVARDAADEELKLKLEQLALQKKFGRMSSDEFVIQAQALRVQANIVRTSYEKAVKDITKQLTELDDKFFAPDGVFSAQEASPFLQRVKEIRAEIDAAIESATQLGGPRSSQLKGRLNAITGAQIEGIAARPTIKSLQDQIYELQNVGREMTTIETIQRELGQGWEDMNEPLRRQLELLAQQVDLLKEANRFRQDNRIGEGIRDGAQQYVESIGTMRDATAQLAQNGIKGVEDAIFSLVTTGTTNFREFAAEILKQTTRMIIQQLILRSIMQIIGAIPGGGGGGGLDRLANFNAAAATYNANGNAFGPDGIMPFAMGGIVTKPTLFKFANGGVPRTGLMGEAGPEAIIPLKRGRDGKLGVSGGGNSTNVTVNVDASGSSVQGNAGQGEALGRAISQAVQQELIKQRRPGGLLAA